MNTTQQPAVIVTGGPGGMDLGMTQAPLERGRWVVSTSLPGFQARYARNRRPTPQRLGAFSDGVFAVIITIMVLELKPPLQPSFAALLPLWPTGLSYAVSYLFIAIVWVNHHHLLRFASHATPRLIWWNFAHLFAVSLVPVSTEWVAVTRFAAAPVTVYAAVFVMVNSAYVVFVWEVLAQAEVQKKVPPGTMRVTRIRSLVTLWLFAIAMVVSLKFPLWGFGLVPCILFAHLRPEASGRHS
jgi:uncharacterized membrane protein